MSNKFRVLQKSFQMMQEMVESLQNEIKILKADKNKEENGV